MKALIDTYIRSLGEREQGHKGNEGQKGNEPEHYQDLGTFMCWLLERMGYQLHVPAYRHDGVERRSDRGRIQWGVDILASKPDDDGVDRAYRFVLKPGDFGSAQYQPGKRGNMIHDLWLAAGRSTSDDGRHAPNLGDWERVTVVAVHNGQLKTQEIGSQIESDCRDIKKRHSCDVLWWQASNLVAMAMQPPLETSYGPLDTQADASLFPPSVRPFARLALDSLQRDPEQLGATFDLAAADQLIEHVLPLGRTPTGHGPGSQLGEGKAMKAKQLYRASSEIALFAGMVEVKCRRVAKSNTLPALDTLARVLCRIMEHLRRLEASALKGYKRRFRVLLGDLIDRYIARVTALANRLKPVLDIEYSLALPARGEPVDYPLRTLRTAGYLATAGLACLDRGKDAEAADFGQALARLARSNEGGLLSPVIDDQIIDLASIWMLWLRLDMQQEIAHTAYRLLERLTVRKRIGQPLPALYLRTRQPMSQLDLRTLVDVHAFGQAAAPGFNDAGSTIIPLAVVLCVHAGAPATDELLRWFGPDQRNGPEQPARAVYVQSWQPPDDAPDEWYAGEIRYRGTVEVYDLPAGSKALAGAFERFHGQAVPHSPARDWQLPCLDWLAWSVHRTPPPMSLFLQPKLWPNAAKVEPMDGGE